MVHSSRQVEPIQPKISISVTFSQMLTKAERRVARPSIRPSPTASSANVHSHTEATMRSGWRSVHSIGPCTHSAPGSACVSLAATKPGSSKSSFDGMIDAGDLVKVVDQPAAGAAPEDEALDEARAEEDECRQR